MSTKETMTLGQVRDWHRTKALNSLNSELRSQHPDFCERDAAKHNEMADAIDAHLVSQPAERPRGDGWKEACEYMLAGRPEELASIRAHAASLSAQPKPEQVLGDGVDEDWRCEDCKLNGSGWCVHNASDVRRCRGKNCHALNGYGHSAECLVEHDKTTTPRPAPVEVGDGVLESQFAAEAKSSPEHQTDMLLCRAVLNHAVIDAPRPTVAPAAQDGEAIKNAVYYTWKKAIDLVANYRKSPEWDKDLCLAIENDMLQSAVEAAHPAPSQAVATPAEVTGDSLIAAARAMQTQCDGEDRLQRLSDPVRAQWIESVRPIAAALTAQCQVRKDGGVASCDWPAGNSFTVLDDPDEHKPCYLVMPDGAALPLCHHATNGVDQARAKFIADACNAALASPIAGAAVPEGFSLVPVEPSKAMTDAAAKFVHDKGDSGLPARKFYSGIYEAMLAAAPEVPNA